MKENIEKKGKENRGIWKYLFLENKSENEELRKEGLGVWEVDLDSI